MALPWKWVVRWWGTAGLVLAVLLTMLVARSLYDIITKNSRSKDKPRSGTLEVLSGGDNAKFEIIAVPGLGADPYHTWTKAQKHQDREADEPKDAKPQCKEAGKVHLLQGLLTDAFPEARILGFAHNSNWLIDAPVKTTEEIGKCLLEEIKDKRSSQHLPIIFIGHSLGGIIIKQV